MGGWINDLPSVGTTSIGDSYSFETLDCQYVSYLGRRYKEAGRQVGRPTDNVANIVSHLDRETAELVDHVILAGGRVFVSAKDPGLYGMLVNQAGSGLPW